jgi:hypothetical protein
MSTLERQFAALLEEMSKSLTATDLEQIRELVDVGELGVAFENFCTQLYERGGVCERGQILRIAAIGEAMRINPRYWQILKVKDSNP